ncbi:MAG: RidA family protein [Deltaproteobacteria bacterium]|nr:MAG: RidA family protein [Deltaproteobacteria bacterium]
MRTRHELIARDALHRDRRRKQRLRRDELRKLFLGKEPHGRSPSRRIWQCGPDRWSRKRGPHGRYHLLAQLRAALEGDLDRVANCVSVRGFVNATPEFLDHPKVVNGASELFVSVFGEAGRHARTAIGAGGLPYGVAVEVDAVFAVAK